VIRQYLAWPESLAVTLSLTFRHFKTQFEVGVSLRQLSAPFHVDL